MLYIIFPFFQVWQYVVFNQDRNLSLSRSKEEIKGDEESKTQKLNMKKKTATTGQMSKHSFIHYALFYISPFRNLSLSFVNLTAKNVLSQYMQVIILLLEPWAKITLQINYLCSLFKNRLLRIIEVKHFETLTQRLGSLATITT